MSDPDDPLDESNDTDTRFFVRVLTEQIQELQNAAQAVKQGRWIDFATGAAQDRIGKLLVEPRNGLSNDDYERVLKAKAIALKSKSRLEDLISVSRAVVNDVLAQIVVTIWEAAAVTVKVASVSVAYTTMVILIRMLRVAVGAGIKLNLEFWTTTPRFHFARFDGTAVAGTGFKSFDGTTGGHLGWAIA